MSHKPNRERRPATNAGGASSEALIATPEDQAPRRSSGTRRTVLVLLLLIAVSVVWVGWYFLRRRGESEAGDKAGQLVEAMAPPAGIDAIRNVLLISIDTCRADRLSCYGYKRPTTPNIDAVARDGTRFKMALTPIPFTTPAHSSMFTGTYPPTHGVHLNIYDRLADSNVTLAEILRDAGYQTAAFIGGMTMDAKFGLDQGFVSYDGHFDKMEKRGVQNNRKEELNKRDGAEVTRPALAWLQEHGKRPFFLFLHYYDAHIPYEPHVPYTTPYADDPYAGEIAYVDSCIGRVLDRLRALGLYDNTLVIVTGDHGEGLGEHGETAHGWFLYQSTLHVPLIIRAPRCSKGIQIDENVNLVDIVPTVLNLVGLKTPARVEGVNLRPSLEGGPAPDKQRPIYGESLEGGRFACSSLHSITEGPWKYILAPRQELYDLTQDPGERTNLADKEPQAAKRLRGRLEQMLKKLETAAPQRGRATVDPEALKRLQSLGYMGGGTPPPYAPDTTREDPKDFLPIYERLVRATGLFFGDHRNKDAEKELLEIVAIRPGIIPFHQLLGEIAMDDQRPADAARYYATVVAMCGESKDPLKQPPVAMEDLARAHFNLGVALQAMGKPLEAIGHYQQAVQVKPDSADAHYNLGCALAGRGQVDEAIGHFQKAVGIKPDDVDAQNNLGAFLLMRGRADEAIVRFRKVLEIDPDHAGTRENLAAAVAQHESAVKAVAEQRELLRSRPNEMSLLNNTAWLLATSPNASVRNGKEALDLAQRALQLAGEGNPSMLDTLAAAYAEAGRFPEAVKTAEKAIDLANEQKNESLAAVIQSRLKFYQANTPFRDVKSSPAVNRP